MLEVIAELSNGHCTTFIRVLLDCTDDFLSVKTLAVKPGLRPAKLPGIRAFFATVSLHTSALHPVLLRRRCGVGRIFRHEGEEHGRGKAETVE